MSSRYPFIEWGVLFREDKEGEPRYAEMGWVEGELRDAWERSNGAKNSPCIFVVNIDFMLLKKALVMIVMKRLNYNPRIEK